MSDKLRGSKTVEIENVFQGVFGDFFEKRGLLNKKESEKLCVEVGATKFRSIVEGVEDGKSWVKAKKTKQGIRLSIVSENVKFFVIDSLAKDVITATRRILLIGEEEARLNRWAREGGYGDDCAINAIGMR
jgi:hypothetical protein